MSDLTIRSARPGDLEAVAELLSSAGKWLASRGIDQWRHPFPDRGRMTASIERGECFLAGLDQRIVGTITVDGLADPEFWRPEDLPDSALYVHRMAVARIVAGQGVGALLLAWAGQRAAEMGKPWLRLDAWKNNSPLHRYYLARGFSLVRVVDLPHRGSGALFQRASA